MLSGSYKIEREKNMSVDKSLKIRGNLIRPRNVYKKTERIAILKEDGKWDADSSVFKLPKVKVQKFKRKGKSAKKAEGEDKSKK